MSPGNGICHATVWPVQFNIFELFRSYFAEQLANALNTSKQFVKAIRIKLTKKQFPCLSITIEMVSRTECRPYPSSNHGNLLYSPNALVLTDFSLFSSQAPQNTDNYRCHVHDIPVILISATVWNEYRIPQLNRFDVCAKPDSHVEPITNESFRFL